MKKIHFILIVLVTLWNASPVANPWRPLFETLAEDVSGGPVAQADPEDTDPRIINLPPPR